MKRNILVVLLLAIVSVANSQTKIFNIIGDSYVQNHRRPVEET